jgi:hypothetical protein
MSRAWARRWSNNEATTKVASATTKNTANAIMVADMVVNYELQLDHFSLLRFRCSTEKLCCYLGGMIEAAC